MEFAVPTRRKSLAPPTDEHRHPFLEGDAPAPFVPVKRATPATAQMQSGMPQWRSSVRPMQPTSAGAAGMTDARRAEIAERAVDPSRGRRFSPSSARPRDGREASPPRGRSFSARSHLLHVDRVPYGHDERAEKAPNSPRREGGSSPRGGARARARGPGPAGNSPYPFDDDGGGGECAVSYERDDRNTRGFGLDEADCFGRAPSPRPPKLAARVALLLRGCIRELERRFETRDSSVIRRDPRRRRAKLGADRFARRARAGGGPVPHAQGARARVRLGAPRRRDRGPQRAVGQP